MDAPLRVDFLKTRGLLPPGDCTALLPCGYFHALLWCMLGQGLRDVLELTAVSARLACAPASAVAIEETVAGRHLFGARGRGAPGRPPRPRTPVSVPPRGRNCTPARCGTESPPSRGRAARRSAPTGGTRSRWSSAPRSDGTTARPARRWRDWSPGPCEGRRSERRSATGRFRPCPRRGGRRI